MDIQQVLDAIGTMTIAEINQVLDAIGARLDQLETKDPAARTLRQAIRVTRFRVSKGSLAGGVREGMRQAREEGR